MILHVDLEIGKKIFTMMQTADLANRANKGTYLCEHCAKIFTTRYKLDRHALTHFDHPANRPTLKCLDCGTFVKTQSGLEYHKKIHSPDPQICNECSKQFSTRKALNTHKQNVHSERLQQCNFCNKAFKTKLALKEHIAIHTGHKLYNCVYCTQKFNSRSNITKHQRKTHPDQRLAKEELKQNI